MRVSAVVHVPGLEVTSSKTGTVTSLRRTEYVAPDAKRSGASISIEGNAAWTDATHACVALERLIGAAIDLRARVLVRTEMVATSVDGNACAEGTLTYPWEAHELVEWAMSKKWLDFTVALTAAGASRVVEVIDAGLRVQVDALRDMADAFQATGRAARQDVTVDRVATLWTGIESLIPSTPGQARHRDVRDWLVKARAKDPGFRVAFDRLCMGDLSTITSARTLLANELKPPPGKALDLDLRQGGRKGEDRITRAVAAIYALRNATVHGSFWRYGADLASPIRAAEHVAWEILDAVITERLTGAPLPPAVYRLRVGATF